MGPRCPLDPSRFRQRQQTPVLTCASSKLPEISVEHPPSAFSRSSRRKSSESAPLTTRLGSLRPWTLAVAGRWRGSHVTTSAAVKEEDVDHEQDEERTRAEYEWEVETGSEREEEDADGDEVQGGGVEEHGDRESQVGFSWVDPSEVGSQALRKTPGPPSINSETEDPHEQDHTPVQTEEQRELDHSLALLTAYQCLHSSASSSSHSLPQRNSSVSSLPPYQPQSTPTSPHLHSSSAPLLEQFQVGPKANSEWHELVPQRILSRVGRKEMRRQGLLFELIRGEREYARDLTLVCEQFITPLMHVQPPVLQPESRMTAFLQEVFSTTKEIEMAHRGLLESLWERQREQWPLISSVTDLILDKMLEAGHLYETYIKNYPYAEARVRRETSRNPAFRAFLTARNTNELTSRRDVSVFLSRPLTRLPRLALMLETLLESTPSHHPDQEAIPTALGVIKRIVRSSQPGIESAESKVKLWDVAETLLFRKGEIIELDVAAEQRTLVHSGYVYRRVRSETNWHGWQDLHAFLLDNYFLLTRDEENGKHVVVSRPIHLDFLDISAVDGVPERRYDGVHKQRVQSTGYAAEPVSQPERLMYPFTITAGAGDNARSYTLCTSTQSARQQWHEKIDGAKTLRRFDIESNRLFAIHHLHVPPEISDPVQTVETFLAFNRDAVAIATSNTVWIGFKRDSRSYRQVIRLSTGAITAISIVPDFPWLLVLSSGILLAFSLIDMLPTSEPSTWVLTGRSQAEELSRPECPVSLLKIGATKGRLLVVYAFYLRNTHHTMLYCLEPLIPDAHDPRPESFRAFAEICIPGYATDLHFFRQTIAAATERGFVICEPGNVSFNVIPVFPSPPYVTPQANTIARLAANGKPLRMCQIADDEFLLVYDWGACFVTKYGELARSATFLRWNLQPSFAVHRAPYLLLFDEATSAVEVRHIASGRVMEVLADRSLGLRAVRTCWEGELSRAVLCLGGRGVLELVETVEL